MKSVTVTGGCEVSAATRNYLHERVGELKDEHPVLTDVELVVKPSGKGFTVLVKGTLPRHGHCESKGDAEVLHDAVNEAMAHFERRLGKEEDRRNKRRTKPLKDAEAKRAAEKAEAEAE